MKGISRYSSSASPVATIEDEGTFPLSHLFPFKYHPSCVLIFSFDQAMKMALLRQYGSCLVRTCFVYSRFGRSKKFYSTNNLASGIISKIKVSFKFCTHTISLIFLPQATGPITVEEYMRTVLTHPEKVANASINPLYKLYAYVPILNFWNVLLNKVCL